MTGLLPQKCVMNVLPRECDFHEGVFRFKNSG